MHQDIFLKLIPVLIDDNDYISNEYKEYIISTLKNNHLLSNKKLSTEKYTEKIDQLLKHTSAKLTAISDIALNEIKSMNDELSMLILVDNIGKENLSLVGTETVLSSIDCISVFEKLRRFDALEIDGFENENSPKHCIDEQPEGFVLYNSSVSGYKRSCENARI